jgi:hypothetical protein
MPGGTPGLVAAYGFEESGGSTVVDASSLGNNGVLSPTTARTAGKFGNALLFDGSSSMVTIADAPSLDLTSALTLEAWVYQTRGGPGWSTVYKSNDVYYLEDISPAAGGAPAAGGTFAATPLFGTTPLTLNTWSHLATTYDGTTQKLYVNGTQVASRAQTGAIQTSNLPLSIGGDTVQGQQFFQGRIDEVRVYNRALSAAEIAQDEVTSVDPAFRDTDADGVLDSADNCRFISNAAQTNSDSFAAGDACQCGDVDVNGRANTADVALLRGSLAGLPPGLGAGASRCAVVAPGTSCDVRTLTVLRRALSALPPGIAQVCPAQFSP